MLRSMPLSSADIAGSVGQWQQVHAGNMRYGAEINNYGGMGGPPQLQGEALAGRAMNTVGAIGGPASALAMGMIGADPLSMGLRAGMGAYAAGAGGLGSAALGAGVGGAAALPMMAAQYAAGQIMTGAQQQQSFNQSMRQTFFFNTPYGQGMTTGQMGQMFAGVRSQAGQMGPGGEVASTRELSQLATSMGQMGMATGVRDVQQFRQRFTEMLATVKTVAHELGTTLSQAQEAMVAMKGSGIFRASDQAKFATQMRQGSYAGLATSEMSAMGSIGSQIARSIGGRGQQGAFAGMKSLQNIGTAVQVGAISENDIYNATGLTGAEGRQALATSQMEQSARFLQSSKGRYFLASVAGKNGTMDEEGVAAWEGGGMDVGATRARANKNLRGVGRANFIRNEGRLRSAALEKFGSHLPAMALQQWAEGKNIDISNMGDREMLFASRQLGIPMDEMETVMKEANAMPSIVREQQSQQAMGSDLQRIAARRQTSGVAGVQRKLEQAREKVQNKLQDVGSRMYSDMSTSFESMIAKMTGEQVEQFSAEIDAAYRNAKSGDKNALKQITGGSNRALSSLGGGSGFGRTGGAGLDAFRGNTLFNNMLAPALRPESDMDRMKKAGYGSLFEDIGRGSPESEQREINRRISQAKSDISMASGFTASDVGLGKTLSSQFKEAYGTGGLGEKQGLDRLSGIKSVLEQNSTNPDVKAKLEEFKAAESRGDRATQLRIAAGVEMGAKTGGKSILTGMPDVASGLGTFATESDRAKAFGEAFTGKGGMSSAKKNVLGTIAAGAAWTGVGIPIALAIGAYSWNEQSKAGAKAEAAGRWLDSKDGRRLTGAIMGGSKAERQAAVNELQDQIAKDPHSPEAMALKAAIGSAKYVDALEAANGDPRKVDEKSLMEWASKNGTTLDQIKTAAKGGYDVRAKQREEAINQVSKTANAEAQKEAQKLALSGVAEVTPGGIKLSAATEAAYAKTFGKGSKDAQDFLAMRLAQTSTGLRITPGGDIDVNAGLINKLSDQGANWHDKFAGMSFSEQQKHIQAASAAGDLSGAGEMRGLAAGQRRMEALGRRGGDAAQSASALGIHLSREDQRDLRGKSADVVAAAMSDRMGHLTDEERSQVTARMSEVLHINNSGKKAAALDAIKTGRDSAIGNLIQKERKAESESDARASNPLQDMMEQHLKKIEEVLSTGKIKVDANVTGGKLDKGEEPGGDEKTSDITQPGGKH